MHQIENHDFFKTVVIEDGKFIIDKEKGKLSDVVLENLVLDEFEYYIHNNAFYLVHFIQLCD